MTRFKSIILKSSPERELEMPNGDVAIFTCPVSVKSPGLARHIDGQVIMYADTVTRSMKAAMLRDRIIELRKDSYE